MAKEDGADIDHFKANEDALANAIGLLVMSFNRLEHDVGELLGSLLRMPDESARHTLVAAMSFGQKVDLFSALFQARCSAVAALQERCNAAVTKMRALEEYRNSIVHSWWGTHIAGDEQFISIKPTIRGGKGLRVKRESADPAMILQTKEEIESFRFTEVPELYRAIR